MLFFTGTSPIDAARLILTMEEATLSPPRRKRSLRRSGRKAEPPLHGWCASRSASDTLRPGNFG